MLWVRLQFVFERRLYWTAIKFSKRTSAVEFAERFDEGVLAYVQDERGRRSYVKEHGRRGRYVGAG